MSPFAKPISLIQFNNLTDTSSERMQGFGDRNRSGGRALYSTALHTEREAWT